MAGPDARGGSKVARDAGSPVSIAVSARQRERGKLGEARYMKKKMLDRKIRWWPPWV